MGVMRKVLITGGTGTLGRALVRDLSAQGHEIYFQYHSNDVLAESLASKFSANPIKWDLEGRIPASFNFESVDVLVNNAGINISDSPVVDVPEADWHRTIAVNLTAPFLLSQCVLPGMVSRGWGRIVNVSSIFGLVCVEGNLPYTVSKHGMRGLTGTIAKEYFGYGITCNEVCPGAIESDLLNRIAARESKVTGESTESILSEIANSYPGGRLISADSISAAVLFLCSEAAAGINGISVPVDSGLTA